MKTLITRLSTAAFLVALLMQISCENESAAVNNVRITPSSITLSKGQSVELTATGGYIYTWELEDDDTSWGRLSTRNGDKTVYTSLQNATTNTTVRIVRVSSVIEGAGTDTNASTYAQSADAFISHPTP